MKILLLGKTGQVGNAIQPKLGRFGEVVALGRSDIDLRDLSELTKVLDRGAPDGIVNAAAYTNVEQAETEVDLAFHLNAELPRVLAGWCQKKGALLVHYSTDYVFDGSGSRPWREEDPAGPLNAYGRSKLEGEKAIVRSACRHLIFRTSWVYSDRRSNFLRTMLRLGCERAELRVVQDQIGAPTSAETIADGTIQALSAEKKPTGIYHLTSTGETSWYGFTLAIVEEARKLRFPLIVERVTPISSEEYVTKAARPKNSRLALDKIHEVFQVVPPDWKAALSSTLHIMDPKEFALTNRLSRPAQGD
ncbi:MAG TPA: dTDP-4-dehydrorhamnose reductase [Bdellovibrionota bacterium]|nr:dTDP-4-dehydrorhamnose reductase [Bdellovibrionota bacterium]